MTLTCDMEREVFKRKNYTKINAETIDRWIGDDWCWGRPITGEVFANAKTGVWGITLTAGKDVPHEWFAPFLDGRAFKKGTKLLGLASGGGQQMPVFAALGAKPTVLDISAIQLATEKMVAEREGYAINTVNADMTERFPFEDESFDIIFNPVSNCYIEDVQHVWDECFRVLRKNGLLLAGMDNGINFLFDDHDSEPLVVKHKLPFNPLKNPHLYEKYVAEDGIQFSHTMEEQVGGQLKAGFSLTALYEDREPDCNLGRHFPQYIATRAVKI
jgi:SAM-dependent methyltransferase